MRTWHGYGLMLGLSVAAGVARADSDAVPLHAYVNDTCIVADEPFFAPESADGSAAGGAHAKFAPLIGIVVGKLAELLISHEISATADQLKAHGARKDTRYAITSSMNLYAAQGPGVPHLHLNARLGCLTIVAAKLQPAGADCTAKYVPKRLAPDGSGRAEPRSDDSLENQLRRANICADGPVAAVYESRIEESEDGTAYRLHDAGYRINSLLTTQKSDATRSAFYTLRVTAPGSTDPGQVLTSAIVNLGTVRRGSQSAGSEPGPWQMIPPPSADAQRQYDRSTRVAQDVSGQIEALQRTLIRGQRTIADLDARIQQQPGSMAARLGEERDRLAVEQQVQLAQLEALKAELRDLPPISLQVMPVTIEVAVTETRSEKEAELALASLMANTSGMVASSLGNAVTGRLNSDSPAPAAALAAAAPDGHGARPKALDGAALRGVDGADEFAEARERYFEALVESKAGGREGAADRAARLADAKRAYNALRTARGLDPLP